MTAAVSTMTIKQLAHLAALVRDLSPMHLEAWLTCGRRIAEGMPAADAEALMWRELEAEVKTSRRRDVSKARHTEAAFRHV